MPSTGQDYVGLEEVSMYILILLRYLAVRNAGGWMGEDEATPKPSKITGAG